MDAARRGDDALAASDAVSARTYYSEALESSPESPVYYLKRSKANHRMSEYDAALEDAEWAITAAGKRGKRELIAEAQMRRGVTLAAMHRIQDAHVCFEMAHKYGYKGKDLAIHEAMLKTKRKGLALSDAKMQKNVEDMPKRELPSTGPADSRIVASVDSETSASKSITEADASAPSKRVEQRDPEPMYSPISRARGSTTPAAAIRHEWYQNNEAVFVTVFAKGVPKDIAKIDFLPTSLDISFPLNTGAEFCLTLDPLYGDIKNEAAKYKILTTKVEITLPKAVSGLKWSALEGDTSDSSSSAKAHADISSARPAMKPKSSGPVNPYSSRGGQTKNWDEILESYQKPAKGEGFEVGDAMTANDDIRIADDDEEGDGPDYFFKKLFKGASPEQQRAMMKSYQESNGTSLSTNWAEVSAGPVPVKPPTGMEEKKYST